jgi:hypothetical protein
VLHIQLVRTVTGAQFVSALESSLKPRLGPGGGQELQALRSTFCDAKLEQGSSFLISWDGAWPWRTRAEIRIQLMAAE